MERLEPLSPDEEHALVCYLKTLADGLDNVIKLLQKRQAGKHKFVDLAVTAQMNLSVMYKELMQDSEQEAADSPKIYVASAGRHYRPS